MAKARSEIKKVKINKRSVKEIHTELMTLKKGKQTHSRYYKQLVLEYDKREHKGKPAEVSEKFKKRYLV